MVPEADARLAVGLVGARGYVGAELARLIEAHPRLELAFVSSRNLAGQRLADHVPELSSPLRFEELSPEDVARRAAAVVVLALPNGLSGPYVEAIEASSDDRAVLIDVSADHRFDHDWVYGQPERFRHRIRGAGRISNPGCYATGIQLVLWPLLDRLHGAPHVFGVSGYSGAGTRPSPHNDPERLRDNLLPYALTGHLHQREAARHLGQPVCFTPHVAPFFRGITLTTSVTLDEPIDAETLERLYRERYDPEPLVRVLGSEIPVVRQISGRHHVEIGGLSVDETEPRHAVVVATLDNLLKGAATQALQNLNLACGFDELDGIRPWLD